MTVVVVHTTESAPGSATAVANYLVRMGYEPHEVFDPSNGELIQLLPPGQPGKALMNLAGGVETNNRPGVYQIEIVGRAVDVPGYDDAWYDRLRVRLTAVCALTKTPYVFPCEFKPYPSSYGFANGVRMTFAEWLTFEGICGHQHVPENDHGDPGGLDIGRLDAVTDADIERIAQRSAQLVWERMVAGILDDQGNPGTYAAIDLLGFTYEQARRAALK